MFKEITREKEKHTLSSQYYTGNSFFTKEGRLFKSS